LGRARSLSCARERTGLSNTQTELGYRLAEPDGAGWKVVAGMGNNIITRDDNNGGTEGLAYVSGYTLAPDPQTWVFGKAFATMI
jgi:hypothetical protein